MTKRITGTITGNRITCVIDGRFRSFSMASDQGQKLAEALKRVPQDIDEIRKLGDVASYISAMSFGRVEVDDRDRLRLDGEIVDFGMTSHFLRVLREGFDIDPLVKFIENLAENPEPDLKEDMFAFLQQGNLPFTEDGCFLAFKRVNDDYLDFHSRTVHYPIGGLVEMPRENCAKHRSACGTGLHVCYFDYLPCFHGGAGRILICKVNPRNVTDIPAGGTHHKLKCCSLEVVGEIPEDDARAHFTSAVDKRYEPKKEEPETPVTDADDSDEATSADGVTTVEPEYRNWAEHADRTGYQAGLVAGTAEPFPVPLPAGLPPADVPGYEEVYARRYYAGQVEAAFGGTTWTQVGEEDGALWAVGDTHYDCHPASGANAAQAQAAGQFDEYSTGFKAGYDRIFSGV